MPDWKTRCGAVMLASMLVEQGCFFKKSPPKASIVIPPAPAPKAPEPLPPPPHLPPTKPETTAAGEMPKLPAPGGAKPQPARPARRVNGAGTAASAAEVPEESLPAPTGPLGPGTGPSLQPILGNREIQERSRRIQQYLDKARLAVLKAERSRPNEPQRQLIGQVKTFLQQAEDARRVDLVRAENLAERAEVLSRGLPK